MEARVLLRVFCPDNIHLGNDRLVVCLDKDLDERFLIRAPFKQKLGALHHHLAVLPQLLQLLLQCLAIPVLRLLQLLADHVVPVFLLFVGHVQSKQVYVPLQLLQEVP